VALPAVKALVKSRSVWHFNSVEGLPCPPRASMRGCADARVESARVESARVESARVESARVESARRARLRSIVRVER
jgi:hypothetical protein